MIATISMEVQQLCNVVIGLSPDDLKALSEGAMVYSQNPEFGGFYVMTEEDARLTVQRAMEQSVAGDHQFVNPAALPKESL